MIERVQARATTRAEDNNLDRLRAEIDSHFGAGSRMEHRRGRKRRPPTSFLRPDRPIRGEPQVGIRYAGKERLLGLPASQIHAVRVILDALSLTHRLTGEGGARASEITVKQVLDWNVEQRRPKASASENEKAGHDRLKARQANVERLLGSLTLRRLDRKALTGYLDDRMREPSRNYANPARAPTISEATACKELGDLRLALKRFDAEFGLDYKPEIEAPKPLTKREFLLTRNDAARVLMASRGYVWDPNGDGWHVVLVGGLRDPKARFTRAWVEGKGGWMTEPLIDPTTGEQRIDPVTGNPARRYVRRNEKAVKHRKAVARLLLCGLYTGTRHTAMLGLAWVMHSDRGCIDVFNGVIHRLGFGEDPGQGKPRASSVMRPKAAFWAEIWYAADSKRKVGQVIHKRDGKAFGSRICDTWWETVADAGLPFLEVHHLRHAAVTWMMMDGKTAHETADALGLDVQTIDNVYRKRTLTAQRVDRRWGRDRVAKGWDAIVVVDPEEMAPHARMNRPRDVPGQTPDIPRHRAYSRPGMRLPTTGRSVRPQPKRHAKPCLRRRTRPA